VRLLATGLDGLVIKTDNGVEIGNAGEVYLALDQFYCEDAFFADIELVGFLCSVGDFELFLIVGN
jgi:hypothetical protein